MSTFAINLFTYGDSRDVNTWSNIPYYFQRALLARGVRVNPINIAPTRQHGYCGSSPRVEPSPARGVPVWG